MLKCLLQNKYCTDRTEICRLPFRCFLILMSYFVYPPFSPRRRKSPVRRGNTRRSRRRCRCRRARPTTRGLLSSTPRTSTSTTSPARTTSPTPRYRNTHTHTHSWLRSFPRAVQKSRGFFFLSGGNGLPYRYSLKLLKLETFTE